MLLPLFCVFIGLSLLAVGSLKICKIYPFSGLNGFFSFYRYLSYDSTVYYFDDYLSTEIVFYFVKGIVLGMVADSCWVASNLIVPLELILDISGAFPMSERSSCVFLSPRIYETCLLCISVCYPCTFSKRSSDFYESPILFPKPI